MRTPFIFLLVAIVFTAACGRASQNVAILRSGNVARVEGCHVRMNHTIIHDDTRLAALNYVCGVSESALNEKNWWGDQPQPLGFTMGVGDCLPLDQTFYCVEEIEPEKATLKATYKWATRHHEHLELIR